MIKTVNAMKARQNLGQIMNEVSIRQDQYIIERNGKPMVAIVPVSFIEEREFMKKEFLSIVDEAQKNADITEEEAGKGIEKALREVRKNNK